MMGTPKQNIMNPVYFELVDLGVINPETIKQFHAKTRDKDIPVLIDETSQVVFLQRQETTDTYYESEKLEDRDQNQAITSLGEGRCVINAALEDDERRFQQFKNLTKTTDICDFGCGYGGFLRLNAGHATSVSGVELRGHCKVHLQEAAPSIRVEQSIMDFSDPFDVVTMFHVLEHIPGQVSVLRDIRQRLKPDGRIVVEVPHAKDFLIQSIDSQAFRDFSFWSEHLVLHTQDSLAKVLESAGYVDIQISGYQRYGFTNHLGWFLNKRPGGHDCFSKFQRAEFDESYMEYMNHLGATDTLIATARSERKT